MPLLAIDWLPWIGALCALSVVVLVLIVVAPWKRVRAEPPIDEEVQTRLLLGEDPDEIERDLDGDSSSARVADLRPEE